MLEFLFVVLFLVSLVGGCFYGLCYLEAKGNKRSVSAVIAEKINKMFGSSSGQ